VLVNKTDQPKHFIDKKHKKRNGKLISAMTPPLRHSGNRTPQGAPFNASAKPGIRRRFRQMIADWGTDQRRQTSSQINMDDADRREKEVQSGTLKGAREGGDRCGKRIHLL
jgi:hypothetical protein